MKILKNLLIIIVLSVIAPMYITFTYYGNIVFGETYSSATCIGIIFAVFIVTLRSMDK